MKKKCMTMAVIGLFFFLLSSCSLGLDPVWKQKGGETSVSLSLSSPLLVTSNENRAVMPGSNYLYIRMDGGPAGSTGSVYGPFAVSTGALFTTSAIPAGTYDAMSIILSALPLEGRDVAIDGNTKTFADFIAMNTKDFETFIVSPSFSEMLNGDASADRITNVTIAEGKVNAIPVLLKPVTDVVAAISDGSTHQSSVTTTGDSTGFNRKYIRLNFDNEAQNGEFLSLSFLFYNSEGSVYPSRLMIYDANGSFLFGGYSVDTGNGATFAAPYASQATLYLYVEYTGEFVTGTCTPSTNPLTSSTPIPTPTPTPVPTEPTPDPSSTPFPTSNPPGQAITLTITGINESYNNAPVSVYIFSDSTPSLSADSEFISFGDALIFNGTAVVSNLSEILEAAPYITPWMPSVGTTYFLLFNIEPDGADVFLYGAGSTYMDIKPIATLTIQPEVVEYTIFANSATPVLTGNISGSIGLPSVTTSPVWETVTFYSGDPLTTTLNPIGYGEVLTEINYSAYLLPASKTEVRFTVLQGLFTDTITEGEVYLLSDVPVSVSGTDPAFTAELSFSSYTVLSPAIQYSGEIIPGTYAIEIYDEGSIVATAETIMTETSGASVVYFSPIDENFDPWMPVAEKTYTYSLTVDRASLSLIPIESYNNELIIMLETDPNV